MQQLVSQQPVNLGSRLLVVIKGEDSGHLNITSH